MTAVMGSSVRLRNDQDIYDRSEDAFRQIDGYEVFRDIDCHYSDIQQLHRIGVVLQRLLGFRRGLLDVWAVLC